MQPKKNSKSVEQKCNSRNPNSVDVSVDCRVRAKPFYTLLNVGPSTFYAGIKSGRYPPPDDYDNGIPFWYAASIRHLLKPP